MVLYIELDGNNISVTIKKGGKTIDSSSWFGEHSLSEQLLVKIDELLGVIPNPPGDLVPIETMGSQRAGSFPDAPLDRMEAITAVTQMSGPDVFTSGDQVLDSSRQ